MLLHEVDYNKHWLAVNSQGGFRVIPKDPPFVRWIKYLIQVLSCGCIRPFDHIRIDRVAQAILLQFNKETDEKARAQLYNITQKLLFSEGPITTYRKALRTVSEDLAKKMSLNPN